MAQYDDVKTGTITLVGVISSILTFVIIAAAQVLYYKYQDDEMQRKEVDTPIATTDRIVEAQFTELNNYGWVDRDNGVVSIPIERAMQEVLTQYSSSEKKPEQD